MKKLTKDKWVWMPHAAHFILGDKCQFHLGTYVGGYIVSTVGELWSERDVREIHASVFDPSWHKENNHLKGDYYDHAYMKKFGYGKLGYNRKYETMVFKAKRMEKKEYQCCPWRIIISEEVDMDGYNDPVSAYKGHLRLCNKWSKK